MYHGSTSWQCSRVPVPSTRATDDIKVTVGERENDRRTSLVRAEREPKQSAGLTGDSAWSEPYDSSPTSDRLGNVSSCSFQRRGFPGTFRHYKRFGPDNI